MEQTSTPIEKGQGKAALIIIMTLSIVLVVIYFRAIQLFQINGIYLYFMQLGLYLVYYLLAWW